MTDQPAEPLSDFIEPPRQPAPVKQRTDPGRYVCRWKPFSLVTIAGSLLLLGGGYWLAQGRGAEFAIAYLFIGVTVGLMLTLAGNAWGCMIALTESTVCGTLFVMFPPYLLYYAVTRWRWMSQPFVLFLCGIGLAVGSLLAGQHLLLQFAG